MVPSTGPTVRGLNEYQFHGNSDWPVTRVKRTARVHNYVDLLLVARYEAADHVNVQGGASIRKEVSHG
jgi:hypothetical protein